MGSSAKGIIIPEFINFIFCFDETKIKYQVETDVLSVPVAQ